VDPADWRRQLELGGPGWLPCFGLHPWFVARAEEAACEAALAELVEMLPRAIALGELGLDHGPRTEKASYARQRRYFERQLDLARERDMAIVLHVVRAHGEVLDILAEHGHEWRGMVHAFSGSAEVAARYIRLGLTISVGGAVTRPGYLKLKNAIGHIPLTHLVVESDAPDAAPTGADGDLNEPLAIFHVARSLAELQQIPASQLLAASQENLCRVFRLECDGEF